MKLRNHTIIAALALLAASCAKEETNKPQISDIQVAITADFAETKAETRATATAFESGDELGLYAVKSGGELNAASNIINNHQLKVGASGAIIGVDAPAYYPDKSSSLDLFSYFPYQSGNATADALGVLVGIRTHQTDFSSLQASDLCYGQKLDAAPTAAPHPLQFRHSFAQLRLNFSLYEGCSAIATVKLLKIKDQAKLNLQTGVVTLLSSVADVDPYVGSWVNSADATNPLNFTAILPAQSLSGPCVEITLKDGTIYYYHATTPILLKAAATNTLNLSIYSRTGGGDPADPDPGPDGPESDKGGVRLASAPAITAWGIESSSANISESTDNAFTFYWSPAITSFASINKAFVTLTNPATKKSARIEATAFVRDAISTAANAIFRFAITRADAASMGYPVTIDKFELFNGGTLIHTLTDYYGRTVTKAGAHTFGTVTSIKLTPAGDWLNAANTAQSRTVTVATTGNTSWTATAAGAGLTVTPASGNAETTATIKWAAQLTTGDSPLRSGTVTFTTVPDGVSYVVSTSQLMGPYYLAVTPATAWADVANTLQTRAHTIATGNLAGWTATAASTPTVGLTVTASGTSTNGVATPAIATWAAQAVGALARSGSVTITPNPASTATPVTISTNQKAGPAPTLTISADKPGETVPKAGKTYTINVVSNTAWTATGTNVTTDPSSAAGSANGSNTTTAVKIAVAKTEATSPRDLSVDFTTNTVPSNATATKKWAGEQEAALSISVDPTEWTGVSGLGTDTKAITVTVGGGATGWTATSDNANLTITTSGNTATLKWATHFGNDGTTVPAARSATVTFTTTPAGATATLSSTQNGVKQPANTVLINGLFWRTMNVGATTPQGYGTLYNWNAAITACTSLGSGWRLPTSAEFQALFSNVVNGTAWASCPTGNWTTLSSVNGAWAGPGASTANSATAIFFPAAGYRYSGSLYNVGTYGYYWSSTEGNNNYAYSLLFLSSSVYPQDNHSKTFEFTVRCVQ